MTRPYATLFALITFACGGNTYTTNIYQSPATGGGSSTLSGGVTSSGAGGATLRTESTTGGLRQTSSGGFPAIGGASFAGGGLPNGGASAASGGLGAGGHFPTGGNLGIGGYSAVSGGASNPGSGGNIVTGGSPTTGGNPNPGNGGATITGGASSTTGGSNSTGGSPATGGLSSTGGSSAVPSCFVDALKNINVYVIKDATPSGADTEGNMYVGGNLAPTAAGYSIGAKDIVDCSIYSLVVGGNLSNVTAKGGKAIAGGTISNSTNNDCGGITKGVPSGVNFATLESQVEGISTELSKLPATNCTVSHDAIGSLVLTATDPVLSICNIDASQLGNVNVNFPVGSTVVINVTGTSVTWGGNVCLNGQCNDSTQAGFVIWNMYQATSIAPSGIAIEGTLLAPLATLAGGGGHVAGQVIVKYLTGGLEYHPYYFNGCIQQSIQIDPVSCSLSQWNCSGVCVDVLVDPNHCGSCDIACSSTQQCITGSCQPLPTASKLSVKSRGSADTAQQAQLYVNIDICNTGSASLNLSGYSLKYWYTEDLASTTQVATVDQSAISPAPIVTASLLDLPFFRVRATSVLQVTLGATTLAPGGCTGNSQIRVYAENYVCCYGPQAGDYSFSASTVLTDNPNITAYDAQGLLIWGQEPALAPQ